MIRRRDFVASGWAFLAVPAFGQEPVASVLTEYEAGSGGKIGLYAENVRSGAKLTWRASERFVMCSTFKASLAAFVLTLVDRGRARLDDPIAFTSADVPDWWAPVAKANIAKGVLTLEEMCRAAVEQSDNTCANLLLARIGGPAALTAFWRRLGDRETRLDDIEPYLNQTQPGGFRNTTTPAAMAKILRHLVLGRVLSDASNVRLKEWLIGCQTGAERLRAGLPANWVIGDKTGSNGKDAAADIAVVWPQPDVPVVICAYTWGGSPTARQLKDVFAGIGHLVAERLVHSER